MQNDQAQCMSLNKFSLSHILQFGFLISAYIRIPGITPRTEKRISPGIKKLLNGEDPKFDKGNLISCPLGEISNAPPPYNAPMDNIPNKTIRRLSNTFGFMVIIDFKGCMLRALNT